MLLPYALADTFATAVGFIQNPLQHAGALVTANTLISPPTKAGPVPELMVTLPSKARPCPADAPLLNPLILIWLPALTCEPEIVIAARVTAPSAVPAAELALAPLIVIELPALKEPLT